MTNYQRLETSREIREWIKTISGAGISIAMLANILMSYSDKKKLTEKFRKKSEN